jgi:hypothetical protein
VVLAALTKDFFRVRISAAVQAVERPLYRAPMLAVELGVQMMVFLTRRITRNWPRLHQSVH